METIEATLSERGNSHGNFTDNSRVAQQLKMIIREERGHRKLKPHQAEALDMICHKIGRIIAGKPNFEDHWRDIAGYATLVAKDLSPVSEE